MRTKIFQLFVLILLLISSSISSAQEDIKGEIDLKSFNLFGSADYFIGGKLLDYNTYQFKIYKQTGTQQDNSVTFTLRPLTKENFIKNFFAAYKKFKALVNDESNLLPAALDPLKKATDPKSDAYKGIEDEASKLFIMFVSGSIVSQSLDNKPLAGEICYFDSILITRRDYNQKSIKIQIRKSWSKYKEEKRLIIKKLKEGDLDSFFIGKKSTAGLLQSLEKDKRTQLETHLKDSLSERFSLDDIFEFWSKQQFRRKKQQADIRQLADMRRAAYEDAIKKLEGTVDSINVLKASINADSIALKALDSLKDSLKTLNEEEQVIKGSLERTKKEIVANMENWDKIARDFMQNQSVIDLIKKKGEEVFTLFMLIGIGEGDMKVRVENFGDDTLTGDCSEVSRHLNNIVEILKYFFQGELEAEKGKLINISNILIILRQKYSTLKDSDPPLSDSLKIVEAEIGKLEKDSQDYQTNITTINGIIKDYVKIEQASDSVNKYLTIYCDNVDKRNSIGSRRKALILLSLKNLDITYDASDPDIRINDINVIIKENRRTILGRKNKNIGTLKDFNEYKKIDLADLARKSDLLIFKPFKVDNIVIEINEGFIENILMVGETPEFINNDGKPSIQSEDRVVPHMRTLKFENHSPIGFSRKMDFEALKERKLYTRGGTKTHYETKLEDLLSIYIQTHAVGRRDYSPANQMVTLTGNPTNSDYCKDLYKESTYRLFEAKVFSDFVGLDETEPNGLIQTEIARRINLVTSRVPFKSFNFSKLFGLNTLRNEWNLGWLAYLEPALTLSKIEDNKKQLELKSKDQFINNVYTPTKFTSTLSLKQFENFSAGFDLNVLILDMPDLKSTLYFNWGTRYGRTAVQDSLRTGQNGQVVVDPNGINPFGVNTFTHYSDIIWSIYEDERYGLSFTWRHNWFYLRDNRFEQVANEELFLAKEVNPTKKSRQFNTIRFLTFLEPATNNRGRLFFRYTYNWQQGFWRTGFHQAQVGYSFFLLGRSN